MIVCKITLNFDDVDFESLLNKLSKKGSILWESGNLFFGSSLREIDKSSIKRILKNIGVTDFFIEEFSIEKQPKEREDYINSWISSFILNNFALTVEETNQEALRDLNKKLIILEKEVEEKLEEVQKNDSLLENNN